MKRVPIVFANGDGGAARVALMVRNIIFSKFPTVDTPLDVDTRLDTNDACVQTSVNAFYELKAGVKISTASNDKRITTAGLKSLNIIMRPMLGAYALLRVLQGPGRYPKLCGVVRYGHGDFYDEQSCNIEMIEGRRTAVINTHMDLDHIPFFAKLAAEQAKARGWHLIIGNKKTIAASEKLFHDEVTSVWNNLGLTEGKYFDEATGTYSTGDFHHDLTDAALMRLPINIGIGGYGKGGILMVLGNGNGDSGSDIMDSQHGNYVMGSQVYCEKNGLEFTFEELATGTADKMATGPLTGDNFFHPISTIFAFASAFEQANPDDKKFFDEVRKISLMLMERTPVEERDTEKFIMTVHEKTKHLVLEGEPA
jgi:isocitrate dehydrogenase